MRHNQAYANMNLRYDAGWDKPNLEYLPRRNGPVKKILISMPVKSWDGVATELCGQHSSRHVENQYEHMSHRYENTSDDVKSHNLKLPLKEHKEEDSYEELIFEMEENADESKTDVEVRMANQTQEMKNVLARNTWPFPKSNISYSAVSRNNDEFLFDLQIFNSQNNIVAHKTGRKKLSAAANIVLHVIWISIFVIVLCSLLILSHFYNK